MTITLLLGINENTHFSHMMRNDDYHSKHGSVVADFLTASDNLLWNKVLMD